MKRWPVILIGTLAGVTLVVAGLWLWRRADTSAVLLATGPTGSTLRQVWAIRCCAVAALAGGQVFFLNLVVAKRMRRDGMTSALGLSALLVLALCLASAIALGLAGR